MKLGRLKDNKYLTALGDRPYRSATIEERVHYYQKEFSIERVKKWFTHHDLPYPQICCIDPGNRTHVSLKDSYRGRLFYFPFKELASQIKQYCPEAIYYDRNQYEDPQAVLSNLNLRKYLTQQLVFDIDSDKLWCQHPPEITCSQCVEYALDWALKLKEALKKELGYQRIKIVYTGRGFHLHVLDAEAFRLSFKQRDQLVEQFSEFPFDPDATRAYLKLIRMPYTLNARVSRIVLPVYNTNAFNHKPSIPTYLKLERKKVTGEKGENA